MPEDEVRFEIKKISDFVPDDQNANAGTQRGQGLLEKSIERNGFGRGLLADQHGMVVAGNKTLEAAASLGIEEVLVVHTRGNQIVVHQRDDLDMAVGPQARELGVADNRIAEVNLAWTADVLKELELHGVEIGEYFFEDELAKLYSDLGVDQEPEKTQEQKEAEITQAKATLAERFGVPPFSVLDARQGYWQSRKKAWIALGIKSELGRGGGDIK